VKPQIPQIPQISWVTLPLQSRTSVVAGSATDGGEAAAGAGRCIIQRDSICVIGVICGSYALGVIAA
jgi:hypothetical protein